MGLNSGDMIYSRRVDGSGGWVRISGLLKHVTAAGNGWIWGINSYDNIYRMIKPSNNKWIRVNGRLKSKTFKLSQKRGFNL